MSDDWSRRTFLQTSSIAAAAAFAGCNQVIPGGTNDGSGGEDTPATPLPVDTDTAGQPITYGISVTEETDFTFDHVDVTVSVAFEGTEVWHEQISGLAVDGETKTYENVIEKSVEDGEPVEYLITAVPTVVQQNGNEGEWGQNHNYWVTPGAESAPQRATIDVHIVEEMGDGGKEVVKVKWNPEE